MTLKNTNSVKKLLVIIGLLLLVFALFCGYAWTHKMSDQLSYAYWLSGTLIFSVCTALMVIIAYRLSSQSTEKLNRLERFARRYTFFLIFLFGSLAATGQVTIVITSFTIGIGLFIDIIRIYLKTLP